MNLDGVDAGRLDSPGRLRELIDDPGQIVLVGHLVSGLLAAGRSAEGHQLAHRVVLQSRHVERPLGERRNQLRAIVGGVDTGCLAVVAHLHAELAARFVNRVGESAHTWDVVVARKCRLMPRRRTDRPGDRASAGDDHGGTAGCPRPVVGDLAVGDVSLLAEVHVHRRQKDTVVEFETGDTTG